MANPTPPPIQSCVLRVGIKCCKGCQTKAKRKLLSVSGVSGVEYNAEEELLTVSGEEVNPTTLLGKLDKWGKKAEIVSVLGDNNISSSSSASPVPRTTTTPAEHHNQTTNTMEKKKKTKCFLLLRCFGKQRSGKAKVEPVGGGSATPLMRPGSNHRRSENLGPVLPRMVYPPPQGMHSFQRPIIPYPPPSYFEQPPPQYTASGMFPPPYFQRQMLNSGLH